MAAPQSSLFQEWKTKYHVWKIDNIIDSSLLNRWEKNKGFYILRQKYFASILVLKIVRFKHLVTPVENILICEF